MRKLNDILKRNNYIEVCKNIVIFLLLLNNNRKPLLRQKRSTKKIWFTIKRKNIDCFSISVLGLLLFIGIVIILLYDRRFIVADDHTVFKGTIVIYYKYIQEFIAHHVVPILEGYVSCRNVCSIFKEDIDVVWSMLVFIKRPSFLIYREQIISINTFTRHTNL